MNEIDKHYLKFDRPHIYRCTCGVTAYLFPKAKDFELSDEKLPENIKYLECGHAACAKTLQFDCIICAMTL